MNICSINRLLQASCKLLRAALRHAVVAVFVQIVLYTGLLGHGDDAGFVGGVAKSHHKGQLLRLLNAQQRGQGGLIDRAHDALANMTLAAWDKGVGSCILGAINKPALTTLLGIEEPQKLAFMVAFGYPTHKASIVPMTEQTGVKSYLDEHRDYCVPKRSAEELARSL